MQSKKLLLFKEMLSDANVQDAYLFDDMVRLTEDLKPSGQFPPKCKVF